jgi:hypothetical protein
MKMAKRKRLSVGDSVTVKPLGWWDGTGLAKKPLPSFHAKIKYIDSEAIAVDINQWWIFFNQRGEQLECFHEGFCPQYVLTGLQ